MDTDAANGTAKGTVEDPESERGETDERQGSFWAGDGTPPDAAAAAHSQEVHCERPSGPPPEDPAGDPPLAEVSPATEPAAAASASGAADDGGPSEDEEGCAEEVRELRDALRMLVYERDVDSIYNGGPASREGTGMQDGRVSTEEPRRDRTTGTGRGTSDAGLNSIPGLVNRVVEEHYAGGGCRARRLSPRQDGTMTELLLAVIVEFAEPHLARAARRRLVQRQGRVRGRDEGGGEGGQSDGRREGTSARKRRRDDGNGGDDDGAASSYDERAVSWSESCLRQVLRSGGGGDGGRSRLVIPELDALLGATGGHDGAAMDDDVREAVLLGFRAHRTLSAGGAGGGAAEGRGERAVFMSASGKYLRREEAPL